MVISGSDIALVPYHLDRHAQRHHRRGRILVVDEHSVFQGLMMPMVMLEAITGERFACAGWSFEIVDLDSKRIDKVLVTETSN